MSRDQSPPFSTLLGLMALFVLTGIPLVAVVWETLNHLLALEVNSSLLIALPAAAVLLVLLYALNRLVLPPQRKGHRDTR